MPYLPANHLDPTVMPLGSARDFTLAVRINNERWRRHYPLLPYYRIKKAVATAATPDAVIGAVGVTKFDNLYGESVAQTMTTYLPPHLSDQHKVEVDQLDQFYGVTLIYARVRREAKKLELARYGFDKVRDLLLTIPSALLDEAGITVQTGDVVKWNNEQYNVLQFTGDGYWKNTNVPMFQVLNCEHRRIGS